MVGILALWKSDYFQYLSSKDTFEKLEDQYAAKQNVLLGLFTSSSDGSGSTSGDAQEYDVVYYSSGTREEQEEEEVPWSCIMKRRLTERCEPCVRRHRAVAWKRVASTNLGMATVVAPRSRQVGFVRACAELYVS